MQQTSPNPSKATISDWKKVLKLTQGGCSKRTFVGLAPLIKAPQHVNNAPIGGPILLQPTTTCVAGAGCDTRAIPSGLWIHKVLHLPVERRQQKLFKRRTIPVRGGTPPFRPFQSDSSTCMALRIHPKWTLPTFPSDLCPLAVGCGCSP